MTSTHSMVMVTNCRRLTTELSDARGSILHSQSLTWPVADMEKMDCLYKTSHSRCNYLMSLSLSSLSVENAPSALM